MLIYISGPINGYFEGNRSSFLAAAHTVNNYGWTAVVPHGIPPWEHKGQCPPGYAISEEGHSSSCALRADLHKMLECEAIYMLDGWEYSIGAKLEFQVAVMCGLKVYYAPSQRPLGTPPYGPNWGN